MEKLLREKGMSIYQLANEIDESQQRTHYIVKKKNFTEDYLLLKKIAKALDCQIEDLLDK